jgi:hypothetical protein
MKTIEVLLLESVDVLDEEPLKFTKTAKEATTRAAVVVFRGQVIKNRFGETGRCSRVLPLVFDVIPLLFAPN